MIVCEAFNIAYSYLESRCNDRELKIIRPELLALANDAQYDFGSVHSKTAHTYESAQIKLSRLNEKESIRRSKGVYYTPSDVAQFILRNSVKSLFSALTPETISDDRLSAIPCESFCAEKTVFDPTCGAGEFLLTALEYKFDLLDAADSPVSTALIHKTMATIHGNDLNLDSIIITKIRLFLCAVERYGAACAQGLAAVLADGFSCCDYITEMPITEMFDIIVGNPPYVEDSKSGLSLDVRYGNIYANVLVKAAKQLSPGGSIGFVVPLSYISTPRMKKLRTALFALVPEQYILSYADRPDCLFGSVHQKLCILIGKAGSTEPCVFTGNYQYWYKEERPALFSKTSVIQNPYGTDSYIPKLGTALDRSIYEKVLDGRKNRSVYAHSRSGRESVYLNRRETFWMKAYREPKDDPEYKVFRYETAAEADYCYCLISSSLFWWYWICTSDCWHVSKELNGFMAPDNPDGPLATALATKLREKLEATKVYVGTVQTEYEYKHRDCTDVIHEIDDFVHHLYGLTPEESAYIKGFAYKYRTSGGA